MKEWKRVSLQLCTYGFFSAMQPSSHFVFQYLNEFRGVPSDRVSEMYFAQVTYWSVAFLFLALLFTDMLRYKPVLILSALAGVVQLLSLRFLTGVDTVYVSYRQSDDSL